ncbi:MAG: hypothetical protein A3G24_08360 [Betaproteobacteria bacterium RIFCSPLOWO2_12_FULL_62_13]|nr:MAG: hypothetical protein A3G24_08360 [Betaproteobacteria bacterium RIFCSPLOWO2_12_FULL_62_13]
MNKSILSTLISVTLAAAAPLAVGQSANPSADGPQVRHHAQRHHESQRAVRLPSERIEARLAYLKTALKITDAQQQQWDAFADTLRKHAREMDERVQARRSQMEQRPQEVQPTAIERLERRQARLAAASVRLSETLAAARPLYAALTPEQQKVADELLSPWRHGTFRHRGMHGRA